MSKILQKPLACRNAHCGAMCSPADAEFYSKLFGNNPKKCPNYKLDRKRGKQMTIDEVIILYEGMAEANQKIVDTHRISDELTIDELYCDDTEIIEEKLALYKKDADNYRRLAEWLRDYKRLLKQEQDESKDIHLPLYKVGDRIKPGTDGNAYKLSISNGKEFEKQPCEDCVSRQIVIETIFKQGSAEELEIDFAKLLLLRRAINALPPVTPTHKKGHWIKTGQSFVNPNKFLCYSCSECGLDVGKVKTRFCPSCGTEMESEG